MKKEIYKKANTLEVRLEKETEQRSYFLSGGHSVYLANNGKFNCDCTFSALNPGQLCSHVVAVVVKTARGDPIE